MNELISSRLEGKNRKMLVADKGFRGGREREEWQQNKLQ